MCSRGVVEPRAVPAPIATESLLYLLVAATQSELHRDIRCSWADRRRTEDVVQHEHIERQNEHSAISRCQRPRQGDLCYVSSQAQRCRQVQRLREVLDL